MSDPLDDINHLARQLAAAVDEAIVYRARDRDELDRYKDQVADLNARIAHLEAQTPDPDPDPGPDPVRSPPDGPRYLPLAGITHPGGKGIEPSGDVSRRLLESFYGAGPVPAAAAVRGYAPFAAAGTSEGDVVHVRMAAGDQGPAHGGATGTHELWLPFPDGPHPDAVAAADLFFHDEVGASWDPGQTGKFFGLVSFDRAGPDPWAYWPGGGRYGAGNYSVRAAHWWWDRNGEAARPPAGSGPDRYAGTTWRPSLYLYLDGPAGSQVEAWDGDGNAVPLNYVSNEGRTVEIVAWDYGAPKVGTWQTWTIEAQANTPGEGDGTATLKIGADTVLHVTGVRWASQPRGFTEVYGAFIIGGPPSFAPRTADKATHIRYRHLHGRRG